MADEPIPEPPLRAALAAADRWFAAQLGSIGVGREDFWAIVRSFTIAGAAGFIFLQLRLPLPWMLGPLSASLIMATLNRPLVRPKFLLLPMRAIIGTAIGATFTPALWGRAGGVLTSLALTLPFTALISLLGVVFLTRFAKWDRPTAFFSAAPGGLADMAIMAADAGASIRHVTLVQAARILTIVFLIPFWLQYVQHQPIGGAMPQTMHITELLVVDAVVIGIIAYAGWQIATRLGLIAASMIGPLLLSGFLHGLGLTTVKVPSEILILAQITIGIVIGGNFLGVTLREFVSILSWGFGFAVLLVAVSAGFSYAVAVLTGIDATTMLLAYAPGGQNEMALLALVLHLDVAIVALHQLIRVAMVIIGAQFVLKANKTWRAGPLE
jgi:membrane AbrB-like protein